MPPIGMVPITARANNTAASLPLGPAGGGNAAEAVQDVGVGEGHGAVPGWPHGWEGLGRGDGEGVGLGASTVYSVVFVYGTGMCAPVES
jgi:hypothetical protein